jgi:hypothetical protein
MTTYDFILRFQLPDTAADPAHVIDAIFEAGCDDAVVGIGTPGSIALDFSRDAPTAEDAINSATNAVIRAIPGAKLAEVTANCLIAPSSAEH